MTAQMLIAFALGVERFFVRSAGDLVSENDVSKEWNRVLFRTLLLLKPFCQFSGFVHSHY